MTLRVLVTGAAGQLGQALRATVPQQIDARWATHAELDIGNPASIDTYLASFAPDVIINTAAYTAVDQAESDAAAAMSINAHAPALLAAAAERLGNTRLIQVSTDFVFDGAGSVPYTTDATLAPLNVYGRSKAAGELAVQRVLGGKAVVVRTAWVYSAVGHNFFRTMLRLLRQHGEVSVVDDQIGTPTAAKSLASVLWSFAAHEALGGVFHWTDDGVASWYEFAVAIAEEGIAAGLLDPAVVVKPIASSGYPTAAQRPRYSVLDTSSTIASLGLETVHWRKWLRAVMQEAAIG